MMSGEFIQLLTTPTDYVSDSCTRKKPYVRVDSYLDAVSLTPQQDLTFRMPGMTAAPAAGGRPDHDLEPWRRIVTPAAATSSASPEWDTLGRQPG